MAAPSVSAVHTHIPTLKHYFSATVFHDASPHSRVSRSSSSSSSLSYTSPGCASYTDSPVSSITSSRSASWSEPSESPSRDNTRCLKRPRPLPTPPTTPRVQHALHRASLPPRPLPRPPLVRAQSVEGFKPSGRSNPLPAPPTAPAPPATTPGLLPSLQEASTPKAGPSVPRLVPRPEVAATPLTSHAGGRPSIQLSIPSAAGSKDAAPMPSPGIPTPLSPIAFNFPGPRDLRRRREEELSRQMKELGFVEAPDPPPAPSRDIPDALRPGKRPPGGHVPAFSVSFNEFESDDERDVVFLVEHPESDAELEEAHPPTRSESRAAMLTLFANVEEEDEDEALDDVPGDLCTTAPAEVAMDVQVEVITKKAVARTKRRFSRKWVREKKGKRWTEQDFSGIISELRKLR